ncbi:MAG: hypothetical protein EXR86_01515 [Gammaproteobacteria bacterium]|nr:hypothetical protein [Gammaproteobacteria bacterium]
MAVPAPAYTLAELVLRFNCGDSLHGVLRYNDTELTYAEVGQLRGQVWDDEDADRIQAGDGYNSPDGLLSNIQVKLLQDGQVVDVDWTGVGFEFEVLAGDYQLEVVPPPGRAVTLRDLGGNENRDSDLDPSTHRSDLITAALAVSNFLTAGLTGPAPTLLPLPSTALQPLVPGTRTVYSSVVGNVETMATDQVLLGQAKIDRGIGRRIVDSSRNSFVLSNDTRGLRLHRASLYNRRTGKSKPVTFEPALVLLPPVVNVGAHVSRGQATTTLANGGKATVSYRYRSSVYATGNALFRHGNYAAMNSDNSLHFSGPLGGTNFDALTLSHDTYALAAGVMQSITPEASTSTNVSYFRQGLGNDADGDRGSDVAWTDPAIRTISARNLRADPNSDLSLATLVGAQAVVLRGDFDGDGRVDLVARDSDTGLVSLLSSKSNGNPNAETPRYLEPVSFSPLAALPVAATNFDADGIAEILWQEIGTGKLSLWAMQGHSPPQSGIALIAENDAPLTIPMGSRVATTGDFDAEGSSDLVVRNDGAGAVEIWFMHGIRRHSVTTIESLSPVWQLVAANDFNGNGRSDLLWADANGGAQVWLMDGAKVVTKGKFAASPISQEVVDTGDYNADGAADILWQETQTKALSRWLMLGAHRVSIAPVALDPNLEIVALP